MKHLCCTKAITIFFILFTFLEASINSKSAIVYYGDKIPYSLIGIHDYIIVQPDHVNTATHGFKLYKNNIYAYVSIGEAEKEESYYKDIQTEWIIGENNLWNAKVMDISSEKYHNFLFKKVIDPLIKKGFKNFFFDTLDSYHLASKTAEEKNKMSQGLVQFIKQFNRLYPESKLVINRGFDIIDEVHEGIEAVLFESLFNGLSSKDLSYEKINNEDRTWLKAQMQKVKAHNIPIIIVDYLPSGSKKIDKNIKDIVALGAIPYIADKDLYSIGKSSKNAIKREVLLLYDDTQFDGTDADDKIYSTAFLQLSMPIEYLGYVPILKPISTWNSSKIDANKYAGSIVWINGEYAIKNPKKFESKLLSILDNKIKLLILDSIPIQKSTKLLKALNIEIKNSENINPKVKKEVYCKDNYAGFEIDPYIPSIYEQYIPKNSEAFCTLKIGEKKSILGAITPWGGYALDGILMTNIDKNDMWIINPFKLISKTLRLPKIPVPDVTTQNGKRLLFVHIDGDGIMNRAEWDSKKFSGEVLKDEIFSKYKIPISLSIIESETAPHGLYPKDSKELEQIAKDIFKIDNIEPATHTYTHPFFWRKIFNDKLDPRYHLDIKDYSFSIDREINGSLNYINTKLTPAGKLANMTFWSGDCMPKKDVLEYMYQNNILNMNGGDTTITNNTPWLSFVAPLGLKRGEFYQIFTGAQNENVYTNDWLGPFWGFKRVIQTFKLTNKPRRLKPIDIYFHIYSGSKRASLNALKKVFEWSIIQDVMPIYTSKYIPKVMDFYDISIAKGLNNRWLLSGMQSLHTIRTASDKFVDINHSSGVLGMKKYLNTQYIHLDKNSKQIVSLVNKELSQNYLIDSNSQLVILKKDKNRTKINFRGEVPVQFRYHLLDNCKLTANPKATQRSNKNQIVDLKYDKARNINVTISCN